MENGTEFGDARECLRAARAGMREVKRLLANPSAEAADESAALLRDVEIQLGCVAAILRRSGAQPNPEIRAEVEELQREVALLAAFFSGANKMVSRWLDTVRSRRGYTRRGEAAPLVLVQRMSVEG